MCIKYNNYNQKQLFFHMSKLFNKIKSSSNSDNDSNSSNSIDSTDSNNPIYSKYLKIGSFESQCKNEIDYDYIDFVKKKCDFCGSIMNDSTMTYIIKKKNKIQCM